jgi:hypothetical protein
MALPGETVDEMVDFVNDNGLGVAGTPDIVVELLRSWDAQSGGSGFCLIMHHDCANDAAVRRFLAAASVAANGNVSVVAGRHVTLAAAARPCLAAAAAGSQIT